MSKLIFLQLRILHLLNLLKYPLKVLRLLRSTNLIHALQRKVRHPRNPIPLRLKNLSINFLPALIALQPFPYFLPLQPRFHPRRLQHLMTRNILLMLKITLKQRLHNLRLDLGALRLPQLYQPVRIPRIPRLPAKLEIYPHFLAHSGEALEHHGRALGAEFLDVVGAFVDAGFWGGGVEVEGEPGCGEGVFRVGVGGAVGGDAAFEFLLADVAPGADGVADDGDGEVGHFAEEGQGCFSDG